ncbi:MAG: hypothetical protein ACK4ON_01005 [Bacteroidia bacterium]
MMKSINHNQFKTSEILGIDLGNKGSGNTALCYLLNNTLQLHQIKKGKDEFSIILDVIDKYSIRLVCIDAPLSLPRVYFDKNKFNDYMYRECDKACKAMSPMFVGAFTARAIQLKNMLENKKSQVIEVYPKKLVETINLTAYYPNKKENKVPNELILNLKKEIPYNFCKPETLHQLDALICWQSGFRYLNKKHLEFGHKKEGIIIV